MTRSVERSFSSLSLRIVNPNRDRKNDSHPHTRRNESFSEGMSEKHVKQPSIRRMPTLGEVLRAANGVNSRSAVVFHGVFDSAKRSF